MRKPEIVEPGDLARFIAKTTRDGDCVMWTGARLSTGYGVFGVGSKRARTNRTMYAHRWIYRFCKGDIQPGTEIDHLCRHPSCVNPRHLEAVTHAENVRRSVARRTHCPAGHPYDSANTHVDKTNGRHCRACDRARHRALARS